MPKTHLILGGPGAGKTRRLIDIVREHLAAGVRPDRIAFVSFTRKAVREAQARASKEFGLSRNALPYFRTLHSLTYAACGVRQDELFGARGTSHWADLSEATACRFTGGQESAYDGTLGDRAVFLDGYARTTRRSLYASWWEHEQLVPWRWLEWFSATLRAYKDEHFLRDYTDMLEQYVAEGVPLNVDVAIVDEAQDLSRLQWEVIRLAFRDARLLYIAADDDQAIYIWSGADIDGFLQLEHGTREVLPRSFRLAPAVHEYSQKIIRRVTRRYEKDFAPAGHEGRVYFHRYPESVPLELPGSWYLLARNRRFLRRWEELARLHGVLFRNRAGSSVDKAHLHGILDFESWRKGTVLSGDRADDVLRLAGQAPCFAGQDAVAFSETPLKSVPWYNVLFGVPQAQRDYYRAILRRGVDVRSKPQVLIETIHAVKGGEADRVAIMADVTPRTYDSLRRWPDDEWRVWYTGVTRTRGDLHVVLPQTNRSYDV